MECYKNTFYFLEIFIMFQKTKYKQINQRIFFFYMKLFSRMVLSSGYLKYGMIYGKVFNTIRLKSKITIMKQNQMYDWMKIEYMYLRFLLKMFYKFVLLDYTNIEKKKKKLGKSKKK